MKKPTDKAALRSRIARLAGRSAANRRVSSPGYDGASATEQATQAYWQRLEARVDPNGALPPGERRARAVKLWRSLMDEAKLSKAQQRLHPGRSRRAQV